MWLLKILVSRLAFCSGRLGLAPLESIAAGVLRLDLKYFKEEAIVSISVIQLVKIDGVFSNKNVLKNMEKDTLQDPSFQ